MHAHSRKEPKRLVRLRINANVTERLASEITLLQTGVKALTKCDLPVSIGLGYSEATKGAA